MRTCRREPLLAAALAAALALPCCSSGKDAGPDAGAPDAAAGAADAAVPAPADAPDAGADAGGAAVEEPPPPARCPPEMVRVAGRFCVDRYEAMLLDLRTGQALSPHYPPSRRKASSIAAAWERQRFEMGPEEAQAIPLPPLPALQKGPTPQGGDVDPRAVSRKGVLPQGYTSGAEAALACRNAGKRLCTLDEWRTACRGERDEQFPYGPKYVQGRCNVFRESHPALVLHGDVTVGHSDPRLNLVEVNGKPLLRRTGQTPDCASAWEGDAIYDMVGNVDEWIDDPEGTFAGGFYARSTKEGCQATVTAHPWDYFDYSTGVRCCSDLPAVPGGR